VLDSTVMETSLLLLRLAVLLYVAAAASAFASLFLQGRRGSVLAASLAGTGLVAHLGYLLARGWELGRLPLEEYRDMVSFLCCAAVAVYLIAYLRTRLEVLGAVILPLVLVLLFISDLLPAEVVPVSRDLERALLDFHISIAVLGAAALFLTFAASVMYLAQERRIKLKKTGDGGVPLPSLEKCDSLGNISLMWGFPLLTLTIVTGGVWTANFRERPSIWERQETFALLAWVLLGIILSARFFRGWRGRKAAYLTILAFTALILRMIGVVL
jgi:ABC-type uncharacterized transport system permease subunit